ncbi:PIN-like domain-containing protein [Kribbella aluminosa]|uniref:PIN-like domain-containing protein n=1 Tax=Kribbella aluminosa TaxID=416017 RepID=UPI001AE18DC5|nr:PIN-like domain-containing protein [Kribbella aluminosa]
MTVVHCKWGMRVGTALRSGFGANVPQTDSDVDEALTGGLLSLDANVLLNFYRYSPKARQALVEVLKAAGDRAWVSHQAAREFWRNRCFAIDSMNQATDEVGKAIEKTRAAAVSAIDAWAKQTAVPEDTKQLVTAALEAGYGQARNLIDTEVQGAGTISYDGSRDTVLDLLNDLLPAHVGPPLTEDEHKSALAEGERRVQAKIPPGYKDAEKTPGDAADGASGDYLVWIQSIAEANRRDLPLVIVTGDEKEDWWWKHRNHFMGPRQELVHEFAADSERRLFMLRPVQLIEHAAALQVAVSPEAAADVARASTTDNEGWTRSAILELFKRLDAEGSPHTEIIRMAAAQGGTVSRDQVYEVAGSGEDRLLRGFTRPTTRITRLLEEEGRLMAGAEVALTANYDGGATAVSFTIPPEMAEILNPDAEGRASV